MGSASPVSRDTIAISVCGIARPTVDTRISIVSSASLIVTTGEVSVCPYAITSSLQCISVSTRFISSTGHGAPLIIPVRKLDVSKLAKSSSAISATYIAGTPYTLVARSSCTAFSVARGSNVQFGSTSAAPEFSALIVPITQPKQ